MGIIKSDREAIREERMKNARLRALAEQNAGGIEDIMDALVELGDMIAEQDDALVELAEIISE